MPRDLVAVVGDVESVDDGAGERPDDEAAKGEILAGSPSARGDVDEAGIVAGVEAVVLAIGRGFGAADVVFEVPVDFAGVAGAEVEFDDVPRVGAAVASGEGDEAIAP